VLGGASMLIGGVCTLRVAEPRAAKTVSASERAPEEA